MDTAYDETMHPNIALESMCYFLIFLLIFLNAIKPILYMVVVPFFKPGMSRVNVVNKNK